MFFLPNKIRVTTYRAGLLQAKAYRALSNHMTAALAPQGLSLPEWALLGLLSDRAGLRPSDLAAELGVKPPVVTVNLAKLDNAGFITRQSPEDDNRVATISLSPKGKKRVKDIEAVLRQDMKEFLGDIKMTDLIVYIKVLYKLADKL